jgi:hypothetical protein
MRDTRTLFILRRRQDYDTILHSKLSLSTGLYNSANYVSDMMNENHRDAKVVVVVDNNSIDREVTLYRPTHVVIEALWVVPTKFDVLMRLHPDVQWIIRLHSEVPFLSNEGIAFDWIGDYLPFDNVVIAANSERTLEEIRMFAGLKMGWDYDTQQRRIIFLPNYYPQKYKFKKFDKSKEYVDVSCFGAIRPLKNQVLQAIAAIKFANKIGKKLRFHINTGRVEQRGDNVLKNLTSIFGHIDESGHLLVNHGWAQRDEFINICSQMDMGLQVSFSETFNIVAADLVSQGVPLVGSKEIPWIGCAYAAEPTDSEDIYRKLLWTYRFPFVNNLVNQYLLYKYTKMAKTKWLNYF